MIAKFKNPENTEYFDGFKASYRKENYFVKEISVTFYDQKSNRFLTPFFIRFYATASADYCVIWHNSNDGKGFTVVGKATGYGYHRASAAFGIAMNNIFEFTENDGTRATIDGAGFTAVDEAIEAIIKLYPEYENLPFNIHYAHA